MLTLKTALRAMIPAGKESLSIARLVVIESAGRSKNAGALYSFIQLGAQGGEPQEQVGFYSTRSVCSVLAGTGSTLQSSLYLLQGARFKAWRSSWQPSQSSHLMPTSA